MRMCCRRSCVATRRATLFACITQSSKMSFRALKSPGSANRTNRRDDWKCRVESKITAVVTAVKVRSYFKKIPLSL